MPDLKFSVKVKDEAHYNQLIKMFELKGNDVNDIKKVEYNDLIEFYKEVYNQETINLVIIDNTIYHL